MPFDYNPWAFMSPYDEQVALAAAARRGRGRPGGGRGIPVTADEAPYSVVNSGPPSPQPLGIPPGPTTAAPVQAQAPTGELPVDPMAAYLRSMAGNVGQFGELADQATMAQEDQALAQGYADTPEPEGRSYGGIYTAANPLEFLAAGIRQYKGGQDVKAAKEERKRVRELLRDARNRMGEDVNRLFDGEESGPTAKTKSGGFR